MDLIRPIFSLKLFCPVKLDNDCPLLSFVLVVQKFIPRCSWSVAILMRVIALGFGPPIVLVLRLLLEASETGLRENELLEVSHAHFEAIKECLAREGLLSMHFLLIRRF